MTLKLKIAALVLVVAFGLFLAFTQGIEPSMPSCADPRVPFCLR
jgi:hypothetical protein